ncbi:NADPH-dependent FMN reductase [Streptomyces luteolus]|uniref:NADPH-dependent FMN reductase n=1 Tax=Streptomyces luteolus TaxID=3043615 RepID=A0ABT6T7A6_9ACTN|nr:NADPH-dependent FMN reductase [Streptomyces sp. B-S-A12]MDI3423778.1 NADPH-dependent FMN reductase [Streptomyces sp. B-S-A12]
MPTIVLVSGSLRRDSVNTAALATLRRLVTERSAEAEAEVEVEVVPLSIGDLPHFDGDEEQRGDPPAVAAAKSLVARADAVVISTPSYNGEIPGVLKNALDWLSRPYSESALTGRTVAVLSASPGPRGGVDAQLGLVGVLRRVGARVVEHEPVAVGGAEELRTADGDFTDPTVLAGLGSLADAVLAAVGAADARVGA